MKKENGMSLVSFSIIIILLLIFLLVFFQCIGYASRGASIKKYVAKMELIQEKVNLIRNEYKYWSGYNPNEVGNFYSFLQSKEFVNANSSNNIYIDEFLEIIDYLNSQALDSWNKNADSIIVNYCYFNSNDLKKYFELDNIDLHVIINFYTGNVISKESINIAGKNIYRQYDCEVGNKLISTNLYNKEVTAKIDVVQNYGLSQKIKIYFESENLSGISDISEVYYYLDEKDDVLKKCSTLKDYQYISEEKAIYCTISYSGNYSFIIEDYNGIQYEKISRKFTLCNEPCLLSGMVGIYWDDENNEKIISSNSDPNWYNYSEDYLKMANAKTSDGNYWVWIPRFLYKETENEASIEFVSNASVTSTKNQAFNGSKIAEAFSQNDNTGFWIAKYQINIKKDELKINPGQTLTIVSLENAKEKVKKLNSIQNCDYSIMSFKEKNAVLIISKAYKTQITRDLVNYAGGAPNENGYKDNVNYSSSNNIYGVYDLFTSENEITRESNINEEGRFRLTFFTKTLDK